MAEIVVDYVGRVIEISGYVMPVEANVPASVWHEFYRLADGRSEDSIELPLRMDIDSLQHELGVVEEKLEECEERLAQAEDQLARISGICDE